MSKYIVSREELDHVWYRRYYEIEASDADEAERLLREDEAELPDGYMDGKEVFSDACVEIDDLSYKVEEDCC